MAEDHTHDPERGGFPASFVHPTLTLRPAARADIDVAFELTREGLAPYVDAIWGWDEEFQLVNHSRWFGSMPTWMLVDAAAGARPIGMVAIERRPRELFLSRIVIAASRRGRGLGAAVVRALQADAAATGMPLTLSVLDGNPAVRLYERLGFDPYEVVPPRTYLRWPPPPATG